MRRAVAELDRPPSLSLGAADGRLISRRGSRRSRSGLPITAAARVSAPTRCRPRRRCTCRLAKAAKVSASSPSSRGIRGASCCRSNAICSRRSPGRSAWRSNERGSAETAASARIAAERETLRNTLLASISHDLRTPLAAMAGAASRARQRAVRRSTTPRAPTSRARSRKSARHVGARVEGVGPHAVRHAERSRCAATGKRSKTWSVLRWSRAAAASAPIAST